MFRGRAGGKRRRPWQLEDESAPPGPPVTWDRIDRSLMELIGKTPEQIDAMTLPEIAVACLDPEGKDEADLVPTDAQVYLDWWVSLTPEQRLWAEAD